MRQMTRHGKNAKSDRRVFGQSQKCVLQSLKKGQAMGVCHWSIDYGMVDAAHLNCAGCKPSYAFNGIPNASNSENDDVANTVFS
jgi:hypothetical protein